MSNRKLTRKREPEKVADKGADPATRNTRLNRDPKQLKNMRRRLGEEPTQEGQPSSTENGDRRDKGEFLNEIAIRQKGFHSYSSYTEGDWKGWKDGQWDKKLLVNGEVKDFSGQFADYITELHKLRLDDG